MEIIDVRPEVFHIKCSIILQYLNASPHFHILREIKKRFMDSPIGVLWGA